MKPYDLMKRAIQNKSQSKEDFVKKANVFFFNDQLSETEYNEIMGLIDSM